MAPTSSAVRAIVRPGGVLHEEARAPAHAVERVDDRRGDALGGCLAVVVRGGAGVEAHRANTERRRALELLREAVACARPLLGVGGRDVQHVGRVHDDPLGGDLRRGERVAEARHALGLDRHLVAVVLGDGGEELHGTHVRVARAPHRHLDAAVVDRVCPEVMLHASPGRG
jgi:hypothetical protein